MERVEGSDKLLRFRLDAGDGEDRQILSGIAKILSKRTRISRQETPNRGQPQTTEDDEEICQPRNDSFRRTGNQLTVLTVDPSVPNGSIIG